jgi:hypothetical protein
LTQSSPTALAPSESGPRGRTLPRRTRRRRRTCHGPRSAAQVAKGAAPRAHPPRKRGRPSARLGSNSRSESRSESSRGSLAIPLHAAPGAAPRAPAPAADGRRGPGPARPAFSSCAAPGPNPSGGRRRRPPRAGSRPSPRAAAPAAPARARRRRHGHRRHRRRRRLAARRQVRSELLRLPLDPVAEVVPTLERSRLATAFAHHRDAVAAVGTDDGGGLVEARAPAGALGEVPSAERRRPAAHSSVSRHGTTTPRRDQNRPQQSIILRQRRAKKGNAETAVRRLVLLLRSSPR